MFKETPALLHLPLRRLGARLLARFGDHRGFVVTGIPRSGTSLMCSLLSQAPNAHCFNEICYDIYRLPLFFRRMERRIAGEKPIPARLDDKGSPVTSTGRLDDHPVRAIRLGEATGVTIGSKVTVPYLNRLADLVSLGYPVVGLVRDPVFTLGSWRSEKMRDTPLGRVTEDDRHAHWSDVRFTREDRLGRQAEAWNHCARILLRHAADVKLIRYEELVRDPQTVTGEVAEYVRIRGPEIDLSLETRNREKNYEKLEVVKVAVEELCPARVELGYP